MTDYNILMAQRLFGQKIQKSFLNRLMCARARKLLKYISALQELVQMIQKLSGLWKIVIGFMSRQGHFDYNIVFFGNPLGTDMEPAVNQSSNITNIENKAELQRIHVVHKLTVLQQKMGCMNHSILKSGAPQSPYNTSKLNQKILHIMMNSKNGVGDQRIRLIDKPGVLHMKRAFMNDGISEDKVKQLQQIKTPVFQTLPENIRPEVLKSENMLSMRDNMFPQLSQNEHMGKNHGIVNSSLQSPLRRLIIQDRIRDNLLIQRLIQYAITDRPQVPSSQLKYGPMMPSGVLKVEDSSHFSGAQGSNLEIQTGPAVPYNRIQNLLKEMKDNPTRKQAESPSQSVIHRPIEKNNVPEKRTHDSSYIEFERGFGSLMERRRRLSFAGD